MVNQQEKQIDLREIMQVALKRKWLLIIPFILVVAISYAGTYLMDPKYESWAIVQSSTTSVVSPTIERELTGEYRGGYISDRQRRQMQNEVKGLITSSLYLSKLITQLNLDEDPEMQKKAADLQKEFPNIRPEELIYRALIEELRSKISVYFEGTNLVQIVARHTDPIMARDIAQTLAEVYREERLQADLLEIRSRLEFSNTQAQIYKKEYEEKEAELAEYKRDYQKSTIDRALSTQDNLKDIESELDRTRLTDKVEASDRLNFIESQLTDMGIDPASLDLPADVSVQKRLLLDRTTGWAQLMEKYTWRDPKVTTQRRSMQSTLDTIEAMIDSSAAVEFSGLSDENIDLISEYLLTRVELDYFVHKEKRLAISKENIKTSFSTGPDAELQLQTLENEVNRRKRLYDDFMESYIGSQVMINAMRDNAESRYKVIEPAFVPLVPYWPNRIKLTVMGCALGLLLGVGAIILAEVTDNSIKKIESVEDMLGLKVLGTIPKIEFKDAPREKVRAPKKMAGSKT